MQAWNTRTIEVLAEKFNMSLLNNGKIFNAETQRRKDLCVKY